MSWQLYMCFNVLPAFPIQQFPSVSSNVSYNFDASLQTIDAGTIAYSGPGFEVVVGAAVKQKIACSFCARPARAWLISSFVASFCLAKSLVFGRRATFENWGGVI
ncbi:hypothetical protein RYX36_031454 [Vicia faba]